MYDQLNRIRSANRLARIQNGWENRVMPQTRPYDAQYTYDANGNLLTLGRRSFEGTLNDDLAYHYQNGTNKLLWVDNNGTPVPDNAEFPDGDLPATTPVPQDNVGLDGDNIVNGTVEIEALEYIELKPGFWVREGNTFSAAIVDGKAVEGVADQQANNYVYDQIGNLIKDDSEEIGNIGWTVYGKVARVDKTNGAVTAYRYDAAGNRVLKAVTVGGTTKNTHYVRDASGNTMAVYVDEQLEEQPIYGSARLGLYRGGDLPGQYVTGARVYELSNHLGNVLATVTDYRLGETGDDVDGNPYAEATVASVSDYYPFGSTMPGRTFSSDSYTYGFQGQETNPEMGTIHYKYREADPELGRFWSIDPLAPKYAYNSPYAFSENRVIDGVELEGLEWRKSTPDEVGSQQSPIYQPKQMGQVGYIHQVNDEFYTYTGEHQYGGNAPIYERLTFDSRSFIVPYNNATPSLLDNEQILTLNQNGTVSNITPNAMGMVELPSSGFGFTVHNHNDVRLTLKNTPRQQDQWGKPLHVAKFMNIAADYATTYSGSVVSFGDLSTELGNSPLLYNFPRTSRHATHYYGSQLDFRYPLGTGSENYVDTRSITRIQTWIDISISYGVNHFQLSPVLIGEIKSSSGTFIKGAGTYNGIYYNFNEDHRDHGHMGFGRGKK